MRTLNDYFLTAKVTDISTAGSTFVGAITVTQAGSAAGDVDSSTPSAANRVEEGGSIEIISDGASATACEMIVTFVIRR
jgi:hypothetical protein